MLKKMLCTLLSIVVLINTSLAQAGSKEEKLKSKIVQWGLQKTVTVKLNSGEQVKGRITEIKDEFFAIQTEGQATTRQVPFSEVDLLTGHTDWGSQRTRNYIGLAGAIGLAAFVIVNLTRSRDRKPKIIFSPR